MVFEWLSEKAKKLYKKADIAAGGYLPGGVTPEEVKRLEPETKFKPELIAPPLPPQKLPEFLTKPPVKRVVTEPDITVAGMRERTLTRKEIEGLHLKEVVKKSGEQQLKTLGKAQRWLSETLRPHEKEARLVLEKADKAQTSAVEKHNIEVIKLEKEVEAYSKAFGGRKLSPGLYTVAVQAGKRLDKKIKIAQAKEQGLIGYEQERTAMEEVYEAKRKKVPKVIRAVQSVAVGFATAPIGVATLGVGLGFRPVETVKEAAKGFVGLPREIIRRPVETIAEIVGSLLFYQLAGAAAAAKFKVKPKISQSFSVENAVRIGKTRWRVEGTVITKLKHPVTGKTLKTIKTQTFSEVITAPTKGGAVKAVSDTWAVTVKRQAIKLGAKPKVKVKLELTRARGEMTISPTDVEKISRGYGRAKIFDIGRVDIIKVPKKVKVKLKYKPGEQMEALTNILVGEVAKRRKVITRVTPRARVTIKGEERIFRYKALSDIYGKKGAERMMRIQEVGVSRVFTPTDVSGWIGPPLRVTKIPKKIPIIKPPKVITPPPKIRVVRPPKPPRFIPAPKYKPGQIPGLTTRVISEKAVAQITAETTAKIIGKRIAPPKVKVRVKVTPIDRVVQLLAPAVVPRVVSRVVPRVKEKVRLIPRVKERYVPAQKITQILGPQIRIKLKPAVKVRAEIIPAYKTAQAITQALSQQLAPVQVPRIAPIVVPRVVPIVKPTIPKITPTVFPRIRSEQREAIRKRELPGWDVYGKPIRQKKYKKLSKVPLTKREAQSLGLYLADTSLSRTFKIKKTTKKARKSKLDFPKDYFLFQQHKFRGYQIKKGKRIPLKNKWIEKSNFLLDTPQEVRKITLARRLAKIRKRSQGTSKRTKRTKRKSSNNYLKRIENAFRI